MAFLENAQKSAENRKKISEAMLAKVLGGAGNQPYQMAGRVVVPMSPFEGIADVISAKLEKDKITAADKELEDITAKQTANRKTWMEKYASATTPQERVAAALELGDSSLLASAAKGLEAASAPTEYDVKEINGKLFRVPKTGAGAKAEEAGGITFDTPVVDPSGAILQGSGPGGAVKQVVAPPSKNSTTTNVYNQAGPQKKFGEELSKIVPENFMESVKEMELAGIAKRSADNMAKVGDIYSGPLAPINVWLGQLADAAGIPVNTAKLASSETFNSESASMWIKLMQQAGGARGLTEKETAEIWKIVPTIKNSREGRAQLIKMVQDKAAETAELAMKKAEAMKEAIDTDDPAKFLQVLIDSAISGSSGVAAGKGTNQPKVIAW